MPWKFDYNRTPVAIILACQEAGYHLYDLGDCGDVYRNRDLLELFEGVDVLGINNVTPRFVEMKRQHDFSEQFEARRAGEVLRWGVDRGIAERTVHRGQPAWRIINREMQYLAIGPAAKQRAIRIRGLRDPAAMREAAKLEQREMGRRQRAHEKMVARRRASMKWQLDRLMRLAPEAPLPQAMNRFRIEGCESLRNYREVLIDAAGDADAEAVIEALEKLGREASVATHAAAMAIREAARNAPTVSDDDADALGDISF